MSNKINKNIDKPDELLYTITEVAGLLKVNRNKQRAFTLDQIGLP